MMMGMEESTLVKTFKNISKSDANIAGGKGASLGEMTQSGIPVPPGFVILAESFENFITATDLNVEIDSILHQVNHQDVATVENASEKIQALILDAAMPADIEQEIEKYFAELDTEYVAVRSSATAEDGAENAWAGQLDSFLNTTEKDLLINVKKCWASLFTPRAIFYRFEKGLHDTKISVAVVVQKMVNSEISGIAFSVHPVTEDYNQLIIEAGYGLGEAIVSGQITPNSYVVEKKPQRIIDINVFNQGRGLYRVEGGGSEWRDLSAEVGDKQVLSDEQILKFSDLILKIEDHYGFPCDIEWAFEKGEFYIVQSRPITTLSQKKDGSPTLYQKFTNRTMFLMDCEIWDAGERVKLPEAVKGAYYLDPIFYHKGGRGVDVYYNFTDPAQAVNYLIDYLVENPGWLADEKQKFDNNCAEIRNLTKNSEPKDFKKLYELIVEIWPLIAISVLVISNENVYPIGHNIISLAYAIRKESDGVLHWGTEKVLALAEELIPEQYKKWSEYISYNEIIKNEFPNESDLAERKKNYVFHKGKLYSGISLDQYAKDHNFEIKGYIGEEAYDPKALLRGATAFPGKIQGRVALVFERSDIDKVKEGDILVTPMTTPNLLPAMNKAAAFVTDEGGVTCHAAIVAREIAKPCIIGTKIATQVLKDGDMVEVDADNGVVRVLENK